MLVPLLDCYKSCEVAFFCVNFRSAHAGRSFAYLYIKNCKKASTVSCFCLTKQKGSVELILLALQSNSTGSVLINDGTLGAGIKELKPGAAAPTFTQAKLDKLQ